MGTQVTMVVDDLSALTGLAEGGLGVLCRIPAGASTIPKSVVILV